MVLKLGDLEIYSYDKNDNEQNQLRYILENDEDFKKYVDERINFSNNLHGNELQFGISYLVKYKEEFVGYIRLEDLKWDGTLNIEMAISPDYRNKKYGRVIVEAVSNYILEHYEEVKKLRGVIDKSNYASRKVAKNAGFIEEEVDEHFDYDYVYVTKTR